MSCTCTYIYLYMYKVHKKRYVLHDLLLTPAAKIEIDKLYKKYRFIQSFKLSLDEVCFCFLLNYIRGCIGLKLKYLFTGIFQKLPNATSSNCWDWIALVWKILCFLLQIKMIKKRRTTFWKCWAKGCGKNAANYLKGRRRS